MAGSEEVITYKQLNERSNQIANLLARGQQGDGIAIYRKTTRNISKFAGPHSARVSTSPAISYRPAAPEVDYIVRDCKARAFFTSDLVKDVAAELVSILPALDAMIMIDGAIDGYEDYLPLRDGQPTTPIADESRGLDMLYSSGTTGRPKGIRRPLPGDAIDTTDALLSLVSLVYQFDDKTSYLSPAPLYHAAPLRYNMAVQQLGGTCIIMENFDPETALA